MNYSTFIVKLLENPQQSSFENNIRVTEVVAEFSTKYKKSNPSRNTVRVSAWGELSDNLMNHFQKNDFLVIEGILSLRDNYYYNNPQQSSKKIVEITVTNFYPYFLNPETLKELNSINVINESEKGAKNNFPF